MASSDTSTAIESETDLFWKCQHCCYKNPALLQGCTICRKLPSSSTEYLKMADWNLKEAESRKQMEKLKKRESINTRLSSSDNIDILLQENRSLTSDKAEIAYKLISMGHAKTRAIQAAIESDSYEQAQDMCARQKEIEKRVMDLVGDDVLSSYKKATLAVILMDRGHERMMAVHAARACKDITAAEEFLKKVCQIGNRCFPIENLQKCIEAISAEDETMTQEKAAIAGKLILLGYDKEMAIRSAKAVATYELAMCACMKESSIQERIKDLVEEEILPSHTKAEIAIKLEDLGHSKKEAILAARKFATFEMALISFLKECHICMEHFPENEMISMLYCPHSCCRQCTKQHFTVSIREKNIANILCPFCNEPDLRSKCEEEVNNYYMYLSVLLKRIIEPSVYDIFQTKLRDYALMKDPDFFWCKNCKSEFGFYVDPHGRRLVCPQCDMAICVQCKETWDDNHQGMSCKEFAEWKSAQELQELQHGIRIYLQERGIVCPNCLHEYELARGGCMHFTCLQCKHQFCCGCKQPFLAGNKCGRSTSCLRLGLHSHHPRNCHYFLRDMDVHLLKKLLKDNDVHCSNENESDEFKVFGKCPVMEQKETQSGLKDEVCGSRVDEDQEGLCMKHYREFLAGLILKHKLDPVWIMDIQDLENELRRNENEVTRQEVGETKGDYKMRLRRVNILYFSPHIVTFCVQAWYR